MFVVNCCASNNQFQIGTYWIDSNGFLRIFNQNGVRKWTGRWQWNWQYELMRLDEMRIKLHWIQLSIDLVLSGVTIFHKQINVYYVVFQNCILRLRVWQSQLVYKLNCTGGKKATQIINAFLLYACRFLRLEYAIRRPHHHRHQQRCLDKQNLNQTIACLYRIFIWVTQKITANSIFVN